MSASGDASQDPKAKDRKNVLDELYKTEKVIDVCLDVCLGWGELFC